MIGLRPCRIGTYADLVHLLCAANLFEFQRLVLYRQLVATFTFAVGSFEKLRVRKVPHSRPPSDVSIIDHLRTP